MDILDSVILGAIQGLTEFLPVSSSGHLVIGEKLLGLPVAGLMSFDVAVHVGTLVAILVYFWKDIVGIFKSGVQAYIRGGDKKGAELFNLLFIGSVPIVVAGLSFSEFAEAGDFRGVMSVGVFMILVAVVFLLAERSRRRKLGLDGLDVRKAFIIGLFQAVALIPGVSRSGMTISGGLFQGLRREEAARFSFLLGAVAIAGAAVLTIYKELSAPGGVSLELWPSLVGFLASGAIGYCAIWGLMKFLRRHSLLVFAVYLVLVGGGAVLFL